MPIFTVGHSAHPIERFLELLAGATIAEVVDVRTTPRSRHFPHFNRNALASALGAHGVAYTFAGDKLGGRPSDAAFVLDRSAQYDRMARSPHLLAGLQEVKRKGAKRRVALMCSEHEPIECHRFLLISRVLTEQGVRIRHILRNGSVEDQRQTEDRLLELQGFADGDLMLSRDDRLAGAYRAQSEHPRRARPPAPATKQGVTR